MNLRNGDIVYVEAYEQSAFGYIIDLDKDSFIVKNKSKSFVLWFKDDHMIKRITKKMVSTL